MREVLEIARRYKLEFHIDKCFFFYSEITYLGYLIGEKGIRPSVENVEAVLNYPVPRTAVQLHRFLCLASYLRRFIKKLSIIAKPLYDLKKDVFVFGSCDSETFEKLKEHLSTYLLLTIYAPDLVTELHCDAIASGFRAILS